MTANDPKYLNSITGLLIHGYLFPFSVEIYTPPKK